MTVHSRAGFIAATATLTLGALRPVRAQSLPVLRVGAAPADAFAQAWFAQDLGFFTKAGLTVDLQNFNSGTAAASAVVGGSLDIAITTPIRWQTRWPAACRSSSSQAPPSTRRKPHRH